MYLNNCSKQHITHRNINCLTVFPLYYSLKFFPAKHESKGHTHFPNNQIKISCEPDRFTLVFFSFIMLEKSTGKAWLEVWDNSPHMIFLAKVKRESPLSQRLQVQSSVLEALSCLYFMHTCCIYHLRVCSHGLVCGQTNKSTCMEIGTDTHFRKTGARPQPVYCQLW